MPVATLPTSITIQPSGPLRGVVQLPGDKSIAHRLLMLTPLAEGASTLFNLPDSAAIASTRRVMESLGARFEDLAPGELRVHGRATMALDPPRADLDCGSSGTTMRLMCGLLAGQRFSSRLVGSEQLSRRPMGRVVEPLRMMGARIACEGPNETAPIRIDPAAPPLQGMLLRMQVPSAQVKGAIILAGLQAKSFTALYEPVLTRLHTESLLRTMGAAVTRHDEAIYVVPLLHRLRSVQHRVPGDFSSAAFLLIAALLLPQSDIVLYQTGIDPGRNGLLIAMAQMGVILPLENPEHRWKEDFASIRVRTQPLKGFTFRDEQIVKMIDELPLLALAATQAHGETVVRDAAELRVKESDRIASTVRLLQAFGARIEELPDGFRIQGPTPLTGAVVDAGGDHRLALTAAVAGLIAQGETTITGWDCIADSFPEFPTLLAALGGPPC